MKSDKTAKGTKKVEGPKTKRKSGRPSMTAEQKEAAAKARAAEKVKAENMKPEFFIQYQDNEFDLSIVAETAKADFHKTKKRTLVTERSAISYSTQIWTTSQHKWSVGMR